MKSSNPEAERDMNGITQLRDWNRGMDSNKDFFMKNSGLYSYGIDIPTSRIYYYLVVSRREYMDERATELRSQLIYEMRNLKIVSFDRLVDNIRKLSRHNSW